MAIFLDTGNIEEIRKYLSMGIVTGVTTNPTILMNEGVKGGMDGIRQRTIEIAKLIAPLPCLLRLPQMTWMRCASRP